MNTSIGSHEKVNPFLSPWVYFADNLLPPTIAEVAEVITPEQQCTLLNNNIRILSNMISNGERYYATRGKQPPLLQRIALRYLYRELNRCERELEFVKEYAPTVFVLPKE